MHRSRAARPHGMTLIEMLVVVAIVALLVVMIVVILLPDDDRKCRLEAERLAAYMTSASAEADVRNASTRVGCTFDKQSCDREAARIGAALTERVYEDDPRADPFDVRRPVKLTTVITPTTGEVQNGTAWIVFDRTRSVGGVAVRELGEDVEIVVYPDAVHSFDAPNMPVHERLGLLTASGKPPLVGTDPEAREDAIKRVIAFLDQANGKP